MDDMMYSEMNHTEWKQWTSIRWKIELRKNSLTRCIFDWEASTSIVLWRCTENTLLQYSLVSIVSLICILSVKMLTSRLHLYLCILCTCISVSQYCKTGSLPEQWINNYVKQNIVHLLLEHMEDPFKLNTGFTDKDLHIKHDMLLKHKFVQLITATHDLDQKCFISVKPKKEQACLWCEIRFQVETVARCPFTCLTRDTKADSTFSSRGINH